MCAAAAPSEAVKFEPKMTYGKLPVPVYGSFDGQKVGNKYQGIQAKAGETFVVLPWMTSKTK